MPFTEDQNMIQALVAKRPDQPFHGPSCDYRFGTLRLL